MGKGIGNRALKERFGAGVQGSIGGKVGIEGPEGAEETRFLLGKWQRCRVVPSFPSLHRAQGPVKQVAHVGEDLDGLATASVEAGESFGSAIESPCSAIGKTGNGVA